MGNDQEGGTKGSGSKMQVGEETQPDSFAVQVANGLKEYYGEVTLSDVVFVFPTCAGGQGKLIGHRLVLSLRSNCFRRLFRDSETAQPERIQHLPLQIEVRQTPFRVFEQMLRFLYTNEVEEETADDAEQQQTFVLELLQAALLYEIPSLCQLCVGRLQPQTDLNLLSRLDRIVSGLSTTSKTTEDANNSSRQECLDSIAKLQEECLQLFATIEVDMLEKIIQQNEQQWKQGKQDQLDSTTTQAMLARCPTQRLIDILRIHSKAPLVLAVKFQLLRVVNALLIKEEPVDKRDETGALPLEVAFHSDNLAIIRRLLSGKDPLSTFKPNFNAIASKIDHSIGGSKFSSFLDYFLHLAASTGDPVLHCELLVSLGANCNAIVTQEEIDTSNCSPDSLTADSNSNNSILYVEGQTALHIASIHGHANIVKFLIQNKSVPNIQDIEGNTALHYAGNLETAESLLDGERKANVNIPNQRGQLALHIAASRGNVSVTDILLKHGAPFDATDDQGQNALHVAASNGHPAVVLILLKAMEDGIPLNDAMTKPLKEKRGDGVPVDKEDIATESADDSSTSNGISIKQDKFIEETEDTSVKMIDIKDAKDNTTLHLAAMSPMPGCEKVLRILLENGASPQSCNWIGHTPLHLFCSHHDGPALIVELFIENGASIHAQGMDGSTPLHLAVGRGAETTVLALARAGAQVYYQDAVGRTVLDLAERTFQGKMVVPLLRNLSVAPDWLPDDAVDYCLSCGTGFSVTRGRRKHHCRHCGRIICASCSTHSITIPKFNIDKLVRVCKLCHDVLSFRKLM